MIQWLAAILKDDDIGAALEGALAKVKHILSDRKAMVIVVMEDLSNQHIGLSIKDFPAGRCDPGLQKLRLGCKCRRGTFIVDTHLT